MDGQFLSRYNRTRAAEYRFANTKLPAERTSVEVAMIRVLQYLAKNSSEDFGFTTHHLMTIGGLPTQNWTRFRKMLKHLVSVGLVEQSRSSALNLFRITQTGQELVGSGVALLDKKTERKSSSPV